MCHNFMKLRVHKRFIVMGQDICVVNITCIESFMYIVVLDVDMFHVHVKSWIASQDI